MTVGMAIMETTIRHKDNLSPQLSFKNPAWAEAETVGIASVRSESSCHIPEVQVKILANDTHLALRYRVRDAYVLAVAENFNDIVCRDSCVEFFVHPTGGTGYLNFEISMNGTMLIYHVRDPRREGGGFVDYTPLSPQEAETVKTFPTLPGKTFPEKKGPSEWEMGVLIPLDLICGKTSAFMPVSGSRWRGNFYKCADNSSHPHWLSWTPLPRRNFHDPDSFGTLVFE